MELIEDPDPLLLFVTTARKFYQEPNNTYSILLGGAVGLFSLPFFVIANIAAPGGKYCTIFHSLL